MRERVTIRKRPTPWLWRPVKSFTLANVLRLLLGLWIVDAPFLRPELSSGPATVWNQAVVGGCVVMLATMRMIFIREAGIFRWAHLLLGSWMMASPWILDYAGEEAAFWNSSVTGALIAVLAMWSLVR